MDKRKPLHRVVFDEIADAISRGDYAPGDRLPTEAGLSKQFAASRTTVARALRDLGHSGMVVRKQGSGTFVAGGDDGATTIRASSIAYCPLFVGSLSELPYVEGEIHHHLADLAAADNVQLVLQCLTSRLPDRREAMLRTAEELASRPVRGVLYYAAEMPVDEAAVNQEVVDLLRAAGKAVVLVDRDIVAYPDRSDLIRVGFDNRRAAAIATRHLIERGCRRIAFVGIPERSTAVHERLLGYREGLGSNGLSIDEDLAFFPDQVDAGFCRGLINSHKVDGVLCKSDRMAASVARGLSEAGVLVGDSVLLAGFDDDPVAALLPVPLTTTRLPADQLAAAAYDALLKLLAGGDAFPKQVLIDTQLVVRESTAGSSDGFNRTGRSQ
ncbi:GntR family transcriptional regulator [Posidoniimonas polymericola]|uniref:GntR family transcriptional regulator n=1 Tax=Posidoniimonas polymericola TaxID=2528002 RepID=UPI0018D44AF8|nr:GntR family transcriptional regulator [Posidoniimonas polymericola]